MRVLNYNSVMELLNTMKEAEQGSMYAECREAAASICTFIESLEGAGGLAVDALKGYADVLRLVESGQEGSDALSGRLDEICRLASGELWPKKYKALFLTYYDNTWETLKSVYEAFSESPLFEAEIVIIPILRNTNQGIKFVWEDYLSKEGIPNTHYDDYSFEIDKPDIVFYNQPYDGVNAPKFRSEYIRGHAWKMAYVPYSLYSYALGGMYRKNTVMDSILRCDWYFPQSASYKELFLGQEIYKKMIPLGHPKVDCLASAKCGEFTHYLEWEAAIGGRKVILLNTHYTSMLPDAEEHLGVSFLLDYVKGHDNLFLIWRPHPQIFLMHMSDNYQRMINMAEKHDRMLVDRTKSMTSAFMYAQCLVSHFASSVVFEALFFDMPVYLMEPEKWDGNANTELYYGAVSHEPSREESSDVVEPLRRFLQDVENGVDTNQYGRELFCASEFPNCQGTIGKEILTFASQEVEKEKEGKVYVHNVKA